MGFALAAQDDFTSAIGHYKLALKAKSDYPVALNNLAFAQERLKQTEDASESYEKVLSFDPKNKTAIKGLRKIQNQKNNSLSETIDKRGF